MNNGKSIILVALLAMLTASLYAQTSAAPDTSAPYRMIYVVRPNQYIGALAKIKVSINGNIASLSNASYTKLGLHADSVILQIVNVRLTGESVQPLVTFKDTSYFVAFPEEHAHKKNRLILTEVDKESYYIYAQKVDHLIAVEPK
jgi:hypothetical protein